MHTGYETMKYGKCFYDHIFRAEKVIIYGAGTICRQCMSLFNDNVKKKIIGIAVTELKNNDRSVKGIEVKGIDAFLNDTDAVVIIAIQDKENISAIKEDLTIKNFEKIITADYEALVFYQILSGIKRSDIYLKAAEAPAVLLDQEEIYGKMLNVGKFLEKLGNQALEFRTLSMSWGGSSILDYALLRALVVRYQIETYLEIGTYIGDSLTIVSDLVKRCYSISVPENHPAHMKNWCHMRHMNDYSNRLVIEDNIIQYQEDSKKFDFEKVKENIGLYFIDGDHSYEGVLVDSLKVLEHFDPDNNFVVWHDCRTGAGMINLDVVRAIREAAGEYFKNFHIFDSSMCGIYIPDKYKSDFTKATHLDKLVTYKVILEKNKIEL